MVKVFFEGNQYDVDPGTTLHDFIRACLNEQVGYTINGEVKPLNTELTNYNVIEESSDGTFLNSAEERPSVVEVSLQDFTGFYGDIWVADNIHAVKERYNQPVNVSVVRDNQMIRDPEALMTGDRITVMPAGGMKGA